MARPDARAATQTDLLLHVAELEQLLVAANDAALGLAGILCTIVVEADLIGREGLADIIDRRAGDLAAGDHNPFLRAFARSIRMNLPGGRFEVIDGGHAQRIA